MLLVDRTATVGAMNAGGSPSGPVENFSQRFRRSRRRCERALSRIVLAVKAQDTEGALRVLAPHLAPDGFVLSAQNGLNELDIAEAVGAARTMGCFVNFGADWLGPGRILFGNRGAVVVGEIDGRVRRAHAGDARSSADFEPDAVLTDDIWGYLWGKLAYGAMLFAHGADRRFDRRRPRLRAPPPGWRRSAGR